MVNPPEAGSELAALGRAPLLKRDADLHKMGMWPNRGPDWVGNFQYAGLLAKGSEQKLYQGALASESLAVTRGLPKAVRIFPAENRPNNFGFARAPQLLRAEVRGIENVTMWEPDS